ncbi:MFS transporter, partial [Candidatus Gribaldobacteria bacterium]|nr:MFS transporter [Candidatus Gribaldobacteria bacterium]
MFINSQFTCLWLAQTLSQIATNTLVFFIGFFIYKKTTSNIAVSLTLLTFLIPSFLSSVLAGVMVSRMGKKWVLFLSNIFRALIVFLMFFAEKNYLYLYILLFLLALTAQFFTPAESSIIPQVVPKYKLIAANAYFSTTVNLTVIIAVFLSPLLFKLFAYKTIFFIFLMFISSAVSIYFLKMKEPLFYTNFKQPLNNLMKKFNHHLLFIIKKFIKDKKINQNVFYIILFRIVMFILIAAVPGFADKILQVPIEDLSFFIIFPTTVGFIIGACVLHWFKKIEEKVLVRWSFLAIGLIFLIVFLFHK